MSDPKIIPWEEWVGSFPARPESSDAFSSLDILVEYGSPAEWRRVFASPIGRGPAGPFYYAYLRSRAWKYIRTQRLHLDGYHCRRCPSTSSLRCHHNTYERLGCEKIEDLETVCQTCHDRIHVRRDPKEEMIAILLKAMPDGWEEQLHNLFTGADPASVEHWLTARVLGQMAAKPE